VEHIAAIDYLLDRGVGTKRRIISQYAPIGVISYQTSIVGGDALVDNSANRNAEGLQNFAFLRDVHPLKRVQISRVDREKADELLHPLVHRTVKRCKLFQV